ncbi:hypothetical protein [Microcoleus sp. FACHB-68]|nr:hypothetical protein [Microcoleus sp. FACHB-68]
MIITTSVACSVRSSGMGQGCTILNIWGRGKGVAFIDIRLLNL